MHAGIHDEHELFAASERSGARAVLIGRRALVAYGLPVLTADYDLWLHFTTSRRSMMRWTSSTWHRTAPPTKRAEWGAM